MAKTTERGNFDLIFSQTLSQFAKAIYVQRSIATVQAHFEPLTLLSAMSSETSWLQRGLQASPNPSTLRGSSHL
jgi:hypothetical protein